MDEKTKSPIALMAELLATMTERAVEAERQRDSYREGYDYWFQQYQRKDEQLKAAEDKLAALDEYIDNMKKGATENG